MSNGNGKLIPAVAYLRRSTDKQEASIQDQKTSIQQDAPPLFIAAAIDDTVTSVSHSISLYNDWMNSKHSAELHLYTKGGHGLRGFPAESWIIRFEEWLDVLGFLKPKH